MSSANLNMFELNCNAHRNVAIQSIDQFHSELSYRKFCQYYADEMQSILNQLELNLECELSAILVGFKIEGNSAAHISAYSRPPEPEISKLRGDLKSKIEGTLLQCAHRYLPPNDQIKSIETNFAGIIQDMKVANAQELRDTVTDRFLNYLKRTLRMVCN